MARLYTFNFQFSMAGIHYFYSGESYSRYIDDNYVKMTESSC